MKKYLFTALFVLFSFTTAWGAFISYPQFQVFDDNSVALSGGKVYTYDVGTTNDKTTYSDRAMTSANANPVILDTRGEADIYCSGLVKLVITTSAGAAVITQDNFSGRDDTLLQDGDGDTLVQVEESSDEDIIRFDIGGTEQVIVQNGSIVPTTDSDIDLGSTTKRFKNAYIDTIAVGVSLPLPGFFVRPKFTWVESLDYDGGTVIFVVGETVTGAGAGTGVVVALSTSSTATSGTLYLDTRNATAFVNDEVITGSGTGAAVANQISSKNSIVISPFVYYHNGTTKQFLYSDSNLAYEFANLGTNDWSYLYFDDSAIVTAATPLISITELVDSVTEPATYNVTKHGRYFPTTTTNDMVFFAVYTDGSDNILEFFHDGGDYVGHVNSLNDVSAQDVDAAWEDAEAAFKIPSFSTKANVTFEHIYGDTDGDIHWRPKGANSTGGITVTWANAGSTTVYETTDIITNSSQYIEMKLADSTNTVNIDTNGWYFPNGM